MGSGGAVSGVSEPIRHTASVMQRAHGTARANDGPGSFGKDDESRMMAANLCTSECDWNWLNRMILGFWAVEPYDVPGLRGKVGPLFGSSWGSREDLGGSGSYGEIKVGYLRGQG